jgi:type VI secretion system secreted protein Hcp
VLSCTREFKIETFCFFFRKIIKKLKKGGDKMPLPCSLKIPEFPGSSEKEGREDTIDVYEVEHYTVLPVREEDARAAGIRIHKPLRVVAEIDKATPGLMKACSTGQNLSQAVLDFYRINPATRSEEKYYSITLRHARVVKAGPFFPITFQKKNKFFRHMVEYSFVAEEIEWNWIPDSVVEADRWQSPGG